MLVIPISSELYKTFSEVAKSKRMVFIAGLPGVGKSLLMQQLALIANSAGRTVHTVQWDVSRQAFETPEILAKYPEIDGVTDPMIRRAVGRWAREAVAQWDAAHVDPAHMLIGEVPLIGNRLIELAQKRDDAAEGILASDSTLFVVPVPSWEVRSHIENARAKTSANPQHEKEKLDASPDVLRALWEEVNGLAREIGLTKARRDAPYNPYIYGGVYEALLRHRHAEMILVEDVLRPEKSVYEMDVIAGELMANSAESAEIISQLEAQFTPAEIASQVENWHSIVTGSTNEVVDFGEPLLLPAPSVLDSLLDDGDPLTDTQMRAIQKLSAMPLDAPLCDRLAVVNEVIGVLEGEISAETISRAEKFDIYDNHFNVVRTEKSSTSVYLAGMLQSYANVLENLDNDNPLTVIETPLIHVAILTTLQMFIG